MAKSERNCLGNVGVTQLEVKKQEEAEKDQIDEVLKEIERHKAREISLCQNWLIRFPLPSFLPVSVPSVANYC